MRVVVGMSRGDTIVSGSFRHILQMGTHFRNLGHEVVYVIGGEGEAVELLRENDFSVKVLPMKQKVNVFVDPFVVFYLAYLLWMIKPDICSWHTSKIGALGRLAVMLCPFIKKSYYVPHGVSFSDVAENQNAKKYAMFERFLAKVTASKIIGVCNYDVRMFLELGVDERKLICIKNGMPDKGLVQRDRKDFVRFVTAARFEPQKDYETLAKAVHILKKKDLLEKFVIHIYGNGPLESYVKNLFSEFHENIVYEEIVPDFHVELVKYDVFILSTNWEGLPRSIIEAMSASMPVVASDVGGVQELVHFENGHTPNKGDYESFAEAMESYINDREKLEAHSINSRTAFENEYTLASMLKNYSELYFS